MTPAEAANLLGQTEEYVKQQQAKGNIPDPIPEDYFDAVIKFKVELVKASVRKWQRDHGQVDD